MSLLDLLADQNAYLGESHSLSSIAEHVSRSSATSRDRRQQMQQLRTKEIANTEKERVKRAKEDAKKTEEQETNDAPLKRTSSEQKYWVHDISSGVTFVRTTNIHYYLLFLSALPIRVSKLFIDGMFGANIGTNGINEYR
jgi:hypothetical protein